MMGAREYAQATWLTSPNHDLAPVMFLGVGKSRMAVISFSEGVMPVGVIVDLQSPPYLHKIETF